MNCLTELHYLPCIAYFSGILRFQSIVIEKHEYYEKQTYRNRCYINTANGVEKLIIPLTSRHHRTQDQRKALITEVKIDYSQKWLNIHWRAIESAYRKAPFWEHYWEDLYNCLQKRHTFLYDLNFELLTICLRWLNNDVTIKETLAFKPEPVSGVQDLRNLVSAKKTGLYNNYFKPTIYTQVFGKPFVENLSLIDLIFCEGPRARQIVQSSVQAP